MKPRKLLSNLLLSLSRWAIEKHKLRIAVVVGTSGTKITAEMFGEMLSKDHVVRKQLDSPFWDFSIPLSILGIEDRRYSFFEWFDVILEAIKVLIFGKSNPGWVILQMNSLKEDIVVYWLQIVVPDITIVTNYNGTFFPVEKKIIDVSKKVVLVYGSECESELSKLKLVTIGSGKNCDIFVERYNQDQHGTKFVLKYGKERQKFVAAQTGIFMKGPILSSVAALSAMGIDLSEISERLIRTEISIERFIHE